MNKSVRRSNRKKAIPLCFQKSQCNSQFLVTANYKHQIKKLKKVNKELARSLQDAKCRAADQERALAESTRENTQTAFVKMKIKNIVETVKKLVTDLGEVYDVMDGKSYDILKNLSVYHQEARLQIRNPSISTIEESASMSTIEPDLSREETPPEESPARPARIELPASTPSFFDADSSRTEIYNVPAVLASEQKSQSVSNGNQNAVTRASKSLEHTGSSPLDPDSPTTPQPPVLPLNIQLSMKSQGLIDASKPKPITSQVSNKLQPVASTSTVKSTPKLTSSKIPVKKLATSTEDNSPVLAVPSSYMNRRKTFVVDEKVEEPQVPPPVSGQKNAVALNSLADNAKSDIIFDRRGTFVLNSVPEEAKSDIISDRRGTFVMSSMPDNTKSDIISDRRGTFVLNPLTNNAKPDAILDRRGTYFVPPQQPDTSPKLDTLEEQPVTSPPKVVETHSPIQNVVPNQTILLCEDMELTEILPHQTQYHQFVPTVPILNEKPKTDEPGLNEKSSGQPSCTTLVKQPAVTNINSSNQLEVSNTHEVVKDATVQKTVFTKKAGDNKSLASNTLTKTKLLAETLARNEDMNPTDLQKERDKGIDAEKKMSKKENINTNIKCSAKKLPSPIAYYAKPQMSIQNKIFESFSAIHTEPEEKKSTSDCTLVKDDHKESSASKNSLSTNQPEIEKVTLKESAELPETRKSTRRQNLKLSSQSEIEKVTLKEDSVSPETRKSTRKQNMCFANSFSESEESAIDFDQDFLPKNRFSLKPGRKIINPNNNKVFVFKKNSKKSNIDKDTLTESSLDKSVDEDIKNDQGKDIFNFSASSEADKSPITKNKKRKSVMPKNNKRSVNKQSDVGKRSSKTTKRSSKPEVNKDEVPVAASSRKSILCLNKGNSPRPLRHSSQFSRKSVRFTLGGTSTQDEVNRTKSDSPSEENVNTPTQESDDTEKVSSRITRGSQDKKLSAKKKYTSARSNSLTTTGDILKSSSAKSKKSRKRRSSSLSSDSLEDACDPDCSPKKKMLHISDEAPPQKVETHSTLSCGKQEQNKNVEGRLDSGAVSAKVPEEKPIGGKKEKNSVLTNVDVNVKAAESADKVEKSDVNKVKRLFSGVSERRSNKKQSIVDDLPPSEVHELKPADRKKEKNSGGILSELPQNLDAKVTGSADETEGTNVNKVKRPFSGVSERRSNKKQSIEDDLFPSLDDAICEMANENMEAALIPTENEPTEIYNVMGIAKSMETDCNKGDAVTIKTPKQKKSVSQKKKSAKKPKSSSKKSKDKENTPNNDEFKLDVLTSDSNLCSLLGFKDCVEKTVKSKNSKKKESVLLPQNDMKADFLTTEDTTESDEAVGGRSRRHRKVMSFKEPSLNSKMRRE